MAFSILIEAQGSVAGARENGIGNLISDID